MQTSSLSSLGMNESIWNQYRVDDPYLHEKTTLIPHVVRLCFETTHEGRVVTLGVYKHHSIEVLKAWGYKDEEHCSYHAIKTNGIWSDVIEGCPDFKVVDKGFSLTHKKVHVWSDGSYHEEQLPMTCCSLETKSPSVFDKIKLYTPLIVTALVSFLLGGILTTFQMFNLEMLLMNSMGVFITILGLLKIKDVARFAVMFRQYDPIAKQVPFYAKFYPYLETGIGLLILSGLFIVPTQIAVITIYTSTTIGILSSLNAGKKLECGCLGGNIKLPLSKVTIFENLIMISMALFTLITL